MKRSDLEHQLPAEATGSIEADMAFVEDPDQTRPRIVPEPHDCVVAKLLAGRDKDLVFAAALIHAGIVDPAVPVIDGAKALAAAVKGVFGAAAAVQRCTLGAAASGRLASRLSRPGAGCHDFFRWPLGPRGAGGAG